MTNLEFIKKKKRAKFSSYLAITALFIAPQQALLSSAHRTPRLKEITPGDAQQAVGLQVACNDQRKYKT